MLRRLREVVPDAEAVDLVRRLMGRPVAGERVVRAGRGPGLHQGSPLSPLLCSLCLDASDRSMLAAGYRVIRYSGDMAIPVPDRGGAGRALQDAAAELAALRLVLDPVRSQVVFFDDGVPFLGSTVTAATSRGGRLVVEHQSGVLFRLSLRRVRQVVCIGRVGMTTPFPHRGAG